MVKLTRARCRWSVVRSDTDRPGSGASGAEDRTLRAEVDPESEIRNPESGIGFVQALSSTRRPIGGKKEGEKKGT